MYFHKFLLALSSFALITVILTISTQAVAAAERIVSMDTRISIDQQNRASITETIRYDFSNEDDKHGIFRYVPIRYSDTDVTKTFHPIKLESITDENGKVYEYEESIENENIVWKIGSEDTEVTGEQTYVIRYQFEAPVVSLASSEGIFRWNITGNGWDVPIERATVVIDAPQFAEGILHCYMGEFGSTQSNCRIQLQQNRTQLLAETTVALGARDGMSIEVSTPQGVIQPYATASVQLSDSANLFIDGQRLGKYSDALIALSSEQHTLKASRWTFRSATETLEAQSGQTHPVTLTLEKPVVFYFLQNILPFIIGAFYFSWMISAWVRYGKEPRSSKIIVTEFDIPEQLTPLQAGALMDQRISPKEISAHIIYLATLGFITIRRNEENGALAKLKKPTYTFVKNRDLPQEGEEVGVPGGAIANRAKTQITKEDVAVFTALFQSGKSERGEVTTEELKKDFHTAVPKIRKATYDSMVAKGLFDHSPETQRNIYRAIAIVVGVFGIAAIFALDFAWYWVIVAVAAIIGLITAGAMGRRSKKGAEAFRYLQGYKRYLTVAEKDRITFFNDPKKYQELFENVLPFAMILGVEKQWASHFDGLYDAQPTWYQGHGVFVAAVFASDMRSMSNVVSASSQAPSGGAGGGSGGGFGGGGGGSW